MREIEALKVEIKNKYLNQVLEDVGFCVSLFDILSVGDAFVYPGDGASYVSVKFRLAVFRPFSGEIILGRVIGSNLDGIRISLDFFNDVYLLNHQLQKPSAYDEQYQLWYWDYGEIKMYYEIGSNVRIKVEEVIFNKRHSKRPSVKGNTNKEEDIRPAMVVHASAEEPGLGCVQWWLREEDNS
eukprot:TRINITY_DN9979_c0_g1_i1.p1 TRINITY_DN9979_c0_g1~~TRINITY_DN9979_c0_g1_i1.p1  ORF type:complete len:206 (-),score=42.49 TRINITY_DN9979_c0_g1_i1:87-635(-)